MNASMCIYIYVFERPNIEKEREERRGGEELVI